MSHNLPRVLKKDFNEKSFKYPLNADKTVKNAPSLSTTYLDAMTSSGLI